MSVPGPRSRVTTCAARPAALTLVRQRRAEGVLTGQTPGAVAAAGFRRLLADPAHRVVLAVLPGPDAPDGGAGRGEVTVGLAVLGVDPLSVVLGVPQVTVDDVVVHRDHLRCGAGAALLAAAVAYASSVGAAHVAGAVGGHEAERQRFFARMGFAPLTTRRIVPWETLARTLAAWQRGGGTVAVLRRPLLRRREQARLVPLFDAAEG